ncbi:MAG: hypothetical protein LUQ26_07170, partial [Methylococcaceae bacterium]|nr:hypothetical protein [Methylococcaceae bacterium]
LNLRWSIFGTESGTTALSWCKTVPPLDQFSQSSMLLIPGAQAFHLLNTKLETIDSATLPRDLFSVWTVRYWKDSDK